MEKLVSIGLPIVKSDFLEQAIIKCLEQTYPNFELIVLNNSNNEDKKKEILTIVNKFTDSRIKYYSNTSQIPMIENWNKTLSLANGDYYSLLCDDDYWDPNFLEEMITLTTKYPEVNVFHSRVAIINEKGTVTKLSPLCGEYEDVLDFIYHRIKGYRLQFVSDFLVRTSAIKNINGFTDLPDAWGSDDVTWYKLAALGGIAYSTKVLFYYRNSPINISNSRNFQKKLDAIKIQLDEIKQIILDIKKPDSPIDIVKKDMVVSNLNPYFIRMQKNIFANYLSKNKISNTYIIKFLNMLFRIYIRLKYKI